MKKRLTQPKNNKYYIRQVTGGLNGAVAGKPTIVGANVLCNCVGYANGRFNEIINDPDLNGVVSSFKYQLVCNAENFIESAKRQGLKISSTPIEGGIMVWRKGKTLSGFDGAGHVAVVEAINKDGTIVTSESGYNSWAFKTVKRSNNNGRWGQNDSYYFRGCIINPGVKNPTSANKNTNKKSSGTKSAVSANSKKLIKKAKDLAWPKGTKKSKYMYKSGSATAAFKSALARVYPKYKSWSAAPSKGASCDVFVGTCVRASGLDKHYPRGISEAYKYKPKNFKRKVYSNVRPIDVSCDGDILIYAKNKAKTRGHTLIRGSGGIYEAAYRKKYGHFNPSLKKLKRKYPYVVVLRAR